MFSGLNIYINKGIFHCKNLKEALYLHLLEHLIGHFLEVNNLKTKKCSVNFGYLFLSLSNTDENLFLFKQNIFELIKIFENNPLKIKKIYDIETNRIIEEKNLETSVKLRNLIFSLLFKEKSDIIKAKNFTKVIKSLKFDEFIEFLKNYFKDQNFIIFVKKNDKFKLLERPKDKIYLEKFKISSLPKNLKPKQKLTLGFLQIFIFEPTVENIFLYKLTFYDNKNQFNIEKQILDEIRINYGLFYNFYKYDFYYFFDKLIGFIFIPTSRPDKLKNIYNNLFKKRIISLNSKKFDELKIYFLNKIKNNITDIFYPAIIYEFIKTDKIYSKKTIIQKIEKLKLQDLKRFLLNLKKFQTIIK